MQNGTSHVDSAMDVDQINGEDQTVNSRKRSAPSSDEEDAEAEMDRLLPAAAAIKRRRLEEGEEAQGNGESSQRSFDIIQTQSKMDKAQRAKKEVNIKEVVRERREAEEEAAKREEENLRFSLDGMNVEEMRNLAVVEEMEIPDRTDRPRRREMHSDCGDRWDERWNGRKNFKKFRRRGEGAVARRGPSVIVPLEEVKKKDFGIGEDYWLESEKTKKQRKEKGRATQSQSQSQPLTTGKSQPTEIPPELAIDGNLPAALDVDAPRTTRHHEQPQPPDDSQSNVRLTNGSRKRPAVDPPVETPATKPKKFAVQDSDSDSGDELKFRFKKRVR